MSKIGLQVRKGILIVMAVCVGFAIGPMEVAHAEALSAPAAPTGRGERLGRIWARQQQRLDRLELFLEHARERIDSAQGLIDRAADNGKDVAALQASLDDFAAAVKRAHPIVESAKGLVASHQGFDANGNVTEVSKSRTTVAEMGEKLREVRDGISGPAKALRDAVRSFRAANREN
jgi:ABC-type transporter Mla subunit MlaD